MLHAETLQQAYQFAEQESFDLIISDLNLPDSTGVEHVGTLCEQCPDIPLVVLTSSTHLESAVEAMKLGAADFITKPFSAEEFGVKVDRLVSEQSALQFAWS